MKKTQWAVLLAALIITIGLYLATKDNLFGSKKSIAATAQSETGTPLTPGHSEDDGHDHGPKNQELSVDTIIYHAKERLTPSQKDRLAMMENQISRGDIKGQKIHLYHQLAVFWRDTARVFEPFAWYTAEASRLENSENSLTFAAHLFLDNLRSEENPQLTRWKALQSKDLFERSLKLNPQNDSSQVGLGAVYIYGGLESPMEGVAKIKSIVEKRPDNLFAQLTLGEALMISGQTDKAIDRFKKVFEIDPQNLQAIISLADIYFRKGDKAEAARWYRESLPLIKVPVIKQEIEKRINELSL